MTVALAAARMLGAEPGPLPALTAGQIRDAVRASGLTGRGGAAFPTGRKLDAVADAPGRPVVVGNGAEGEPASAKDATLLGQAPHLVLDGLQLAVRAVGAAEAWLYVGDPEAARAARAAIAARQDPVPARLLQAPAGFVSGEESAVVAAIEGRPALPRHKRDLIAHHGVRGRPTLVQNVETLAHIALIARHGANWFREVGPAEQPGTFLATVSGAVCRPGVAEAAYGTPLADVLALAGGPSGPVSAVLVGGYHGAWLPWPDAQAAPLSAAGLAGWGAAPGAGVVIALPAGACGLDAGAQIAGYLAGQSAGQCGPCLNGLPAMATTLTRLARGERDPGLPERVAWLARLVAGRGACRHPDGTVRLVASTMRTFAADVDAHLAGGCLATRRRLS